MLLAGQTFTTSLADPSGSGAVGAAVGWLQGTLLGTVGTTVAIVAVASVGLMMLAGRLPIRRGLTVVFGCFILFGASSIAAGLRAALAGEGMAAAAPPPSQAPPPADPGSDNAFDPYAGAAVPAR